MSMWRKISAYRTQFAVVVIASMMAMGHAQAQQEGMRSVERSTPEFSLPSIDEGQWDVETMAGKYWVVNFWATWCPPCIEEIPSMNAGSKVLSEHDIGMLAINAGEGEFAVREFLTKIPIDFPTLLGDVDTLPNWSVRALPTTIVVDPEGRVVFEALGPREWDDEALLQQVIDLKG